MLVAVMVVTSLMSRSGKVFGAPSARPALLINTSIGPRVSTILVIAEVTAEWSVTSTMAVWTFASGVVLLISWARD
jgi:hypothetical protein